jgi:alkylation response protein AidB-like acyl-CoA dehydrogenase
MGGATRYHPTTEQRALIAGFERPLADLLPISRLHDHTTGETGARWQAFAELGLFGIGLAEDAGGIGLGASEEALLAERLGRQLASPSLIATLIAVHADDTALAARIATGEIRVAAGWRHGDATRLVDPGGCVLALVLGGDAGVLLPLGDVRRLDGSLWSVDLAETAGGGPVVGFGPEGMLRARLIIAAASCGIAGAAVDMAVAYAGMREQFGRPIGAFQAIKHHCANMALAARSALDLVTFAAVAIDDGREDAAFQVEAALLLAIEAALANARLNIQVHGGIGFSDEADPHLLVKRAHVLATVAGGAEAAVARLEGLPGAVRG